ncbi:conjugal transfer protein TraD [Parashewanella curva]|uniref:Conjugal transfer protein TraD n=1 Tax=Parashewanella curva TaxID=2338552 RepID=A0A3L8PTI4_9GAMM|nr:conjugal transfer protein TraD [Parashewanella curva]RLV57845.1 conjugal transfer protein TraD [Parashewanella curva]RLV57913.1 conjugal transfer protein TraD [Parashewanella curva]
MNNNLNTKLDEKLHLLNTPQNIVEVTKAEAGELGAFEEDALSEQDAWEAVEVDTDGE